MIIDAKNISYIRNGKYILENISWEVNSGEHWAVLGLNGSGKTTLLNMINGYIFPSEGQLTVLDKTFGQYDLRELRKSIGWVSTALQERLYGREKVEEIVLSGKFASIGLYDNTSDQDKKYASEILESLSSIHLKDRIYQTLSQGEKQRVLIARALMASPKLLILDEPCTGLDFLAREQLLTNIEKLSTIADAPSLIYVTHQTDEILPLFNKTLLRREGKVHSAGPTQELLNNKNLSQFYGIPVECKKLNNRYFLSTSSPASIS